VSRNQRYQVDHRQVVGDARGERYWWHKTDDLPAALNHDPDPEDISHGALDMRYQEELQRNFWRLNPLATAAGEPIPFEDAQLGRFANTFLEVIAAGPNFAHDIAGAQTTPDSNGLVSDNSLCDDWLSLAIADANVYRKCYDMSLKVVNVTATQLNPQPYLTIGNHSALLANKRYFKPVTNSDLTSGSLSPSAAGDPFGYVFDAQHAQNIVYRAVVRTKPAGEPVSCVRWQVVVPLA
jgi:hypothetical protein